MAEPNILIEQSPIFRAEHNCYPVFSRNGNKMFCHIFRLAHDLTLSAHTSRCPYNILIGFERVFQMVILLNACCHIRCRMSRQFENFSHIEIFRLNHNQAAQSHIPYGACGCPDIFRIPGSIQHNVNMIQIDFFGHLPTISS